MRSRSRFGEATALTTGLSLFGVLLREFNQQRHAVVCRHFDGETV